MLKDLVIHIRLFNSFPPGFSMRNRLNFPNPATVILAGFLVLSSAIASHAQATESEKRPSSIKYQILLQSGAAVPGSDRPLVELTAPAISGQNIAFLGSTATVTTKAPGPSGEVETSSRLSGVYSLFGGKAGKIREVENQFIKQPGFSNSQSTSYRFSSPAIYHQDVAFTEAVTTGIVSRIGNQESKLWVLRSGKLSTLSSCGYSLRSGTTYLSGSNPTLNQSDVVVAGNLEGCPAVYTFPTVSRFRQGVRETIADGFQLRSSLPGGQSLQISGENILFSLNGVQRQLGLYLFQAGQLSNLFQPGQPAPSQRFTPDNLCGYDIAGNRIVFCVSAENKGSEISLRLGNQVKPIVTDAMTVPGESRKFSNLASPSISGENILFVENEATNPPTVKSIYVKRDDKILKIVGVGSALNGATVTALNLGVSPISGKQVVFGAKLSNGNSALVKAQF
jgi:hypothetical protein